MRQFLEVKAQHQDAIVFFRMGDFYEMFFEDAVVASKALDLTLTSRDKGKEGAIPMAGVPHHAGRGYIAKLTERGHKVVVCEQVEDPKQAKGLVKREVIEIVTPGVMVDEDVLDPKCGHYLASVSAPGRSRRYGLAFMDVTTGEFAACEVEGLEALVTELARIRPKEVLASAGELQARLLPVVRRYPRAVFTRVDRTPKGAVAGVLDSALAGTKPVAELEALPLASQAAADVVAYAQATHPGGRLPLRGIEVRQAGGCVVLDAAAVANLELVETLIGAKREGSLLASLDRTVSAAGGRLLRRWLLYPLNGVEAIRRRQDAVSVFVQEASVRGRVREQLEGTHDLERIIGRVTLGVASPRDLGRVQATLAALPKVVKLLAELRGQVTGTEPTLLDLSAPALKAARSVARTLGKALADELPTVTKDGGLIRSGYCEVVDTNRELATGGKDAILAIETRERERTGIPTLKIRYNRVFGYYIEVTKSQLGKVPGDYVRKQTVATAERFVTSEVAELEAKIVSAQEALVARESQIFAELCQVVAASAQAVLQVADFLAMLDCCSALADLAHDRSYVRPVVDTSEITDITAGRHPVVECTVEQGSFVPNDCHLDPAREQLLLITGPNMAGKSTYMRQVALITLMAQMGSYVPAEAARIGIVDRIFTRVGAADNLACGDSTFMVEMRETATILASATRRSLVVLDEVGRGTSTFDGVSIAWAVSEYLHDSIGARTLFATHYHELCALAEHKPRVVNASVAVHEHEGEIVFLRQLVPGGANRSYGIDVARLAGLPKSVISRSRAILGELEMGQLGGQSSQLALFAAMRTPAASPTDPVEVEVCQRLRDAQADDMTPLQALVLISELRGKLV